jgi:small ligand-binding sensory domain FIST
MDEYRDVFKRGDFLIRGLMGIDPATGAGIIGDDIKAGQTIQFQVRDAEAAREDLTALLTSQQAGKNMEKPKGALIFSCNGRGENLFREANHDIKIIQQHIGPVPAAGFFCAGEVGPVCKSNFLHGFTSSIAMFYPPS